MSAIWQSISVGSNEAEVVDALVSSHFLISWLNNVTGPATAGLAGDPPPGGMLSPPLPGATPPLAVAPETRPGGRGTSLARSQLAMADRSLSLAPDPADMLRGQWPRR